MKFEPTFSRSVLIFQVIWILHSSLSQNVKSGLHDGLHEVNVFYFVSHKWGAKVDGDQMCPNMLCNWTTSDDFHRLKTKYDEIMSPEKRIDKQILTAALYNVHDLYAKNSMKFPTNCDWRTNVTLATSEESSVRFRYLFNRIFNNFDGFSTISPQSDIQRVYQDAYLRPSDFVQEMRNFSSLIKAGSYVAKDCRDGSISDRNGVVKAIRMGFRVEGLSKCMSSTNPEGVTLKNSHDPEENKHLKRAAISRFMFYMAFENSLEPGYVTEKPFDALLSGTVPVYLGDAQHLKSLLPHPMAAIFVSDYNRNYTQLAEYLTYLSTNETAYEIHREWRKNYTYENHIRNKPLLELSWHCRVCQWVIDNTNKISHLKADKKCNEVEKTHNFCDNIPEFEGRLVNVRPNKHFAYYIVVDKTLRAVPDENTLESFQMEADDAIIITHEELKKCILGRPFKSF